METKKEIFEKDGKKYMKCHADFGYGIYSLRIIDETDNFVLCYHPTSQATPNQISGVVVCSPEFIIFPKERDSQKPLGLWDIEYNRKTRKDALIEAKQKLRDLENQKQGEEDKEEK